MSRIIQPGGVPAVRIVIEMDSKGVVNMMATNLQNPLIPVPALMAAGILSTLTTTALQQAQQRQQAREIPKHGESE